MSKERIKDLADFFYSSDDCREVPLRLAVTSGRFVGFDLSKGEFVELFTILNGSVALREDLAVFLEKLKDEE